MFAALIWASANVFFVAFFLIGEIDDEPEDPLLLETLDSFEVKADFDFELLGVLTPDMAVELEALVSLNPDVAVLETGFFPAFALDEELDERVPLLVDDCEFPDAALLLVVVVVPAFEELTWLVVSMII